MNAISRPTGPSKHPTVRPAQSSDLPAMVGLAVRDSFAGAYSPIIASHPDVFSDQLAKAVQHGFYPVETPSAVVMTRCFVFVIELQSVVVGFAVALVDPAQTTSTDAIVIECLMLSVEADHEGGGLAGVLVTHARQEILRRGGVVKFRVRCLPPALSPAIRALLSAFNFVQISQAPNSVYEFESIV